MRTAKRSLNALLLAAVLAAAFPAVHAADQATAAAPTGAVPASTADAGQADAKTTTPTPNGSAPAVCFPLTMQCLGGNTPATTDGAQKAATTATTKPKSGRSSTAATGKTAPRAGATTTDATSSGPPAPASQGSMNLAAPDIRTVVSAEELKEPLPSEDQQAEVQDAETIQVKGANDAPDVPGGFGALWWAMKHPSQAWRIFSPAE
jgi:hypothetical protein